MRVDRQIRSRQRKDAGLEERAPAGSVSTCLPEQRDSTHHSTVIVDIDVTDRAVSLGVCEKRQHMPGSRALTLTKKGWRAIQGVF